MSDIIRRVYATKFFFSLRLTEIVIGNSLIRYFYPRRFMRRKRRKSLFVFSFSFCVYSTRRRSTGVQEEMSEFSYRHYDSACKL